MFLREHLFVLNARLDELRPLHQRRATINKRHLIQPISIRNNSILANHSTTEGTMTGGTITGTMIVVITIGGIAIEGMTVGMMIDMMIGNSVDQDSDV